LFGAGLGMYGNICRDNPPTPVFHLHVHNTYLEVLSESGIFGFLALLWIFIVFFKKTFRQIKDQISKGENRAILIGFWGMVAAIAFFEFFGSCILVGMQAAPLFWFLLGFAAQSYHKARSSQA
jgi:O-antigen ligase